MGRISSAHGGVFLFRRSLNMNFGVLKLLDWLFALNKADAVRPIEFVSMD